MRRKVKNRNKPGQDFKYKSENVSKFINSLMFDGKKSVASFVVYDAFDSIKEKEKTDNPVEIFEKAIDNAGPSIEVRSRRIGGATYQVPREVNESRKRALAIRWIIQAARSKSGVSMASRLADELLAASKNEGEAIKRKENTHKMAEANRAFAHFAW